MKDESPTLKPGREVTVMKHLASVVTLLFLREVTVMKHLASVVTLMFLREVTVMKHLASLVTLLFLREVTVMKHLASLVTLMFLPKTLIWNKITFPGSNSLNFAELVENELIKSISKKIYQYSFFYLIYHCLL